MLPVHQGEEIIAGEKKTDTSSRHKRSLILVTSVILLFSFLLSFASLKKDKFLKPPLM